MDECQSIPRRQEIDRFGSLDEQFACDHFLGKSLDEAREMFQENSMLFQEDLMWMGPVSFRFYILAAMGYVRSADADDDADFVNSLAGTFAFRLEHEPVELRPIAPALAEFCREVVDGFAPFDAAPEIYGDLSGKYGKLRTLFGSLVLDQVKSG